MAGVAVAARLHDADDRTTSCRYGEKEKAQPGGRTAECVFGHHRAAWENEKKQNDDVNPAQPSVPASMAATNVCAQQNEPSEKHDGRCKYVYVERSPLAPERRLAALQEERMEIGREVVGIVRKNDDQHPQDQHYREPAENCR